MRWYCQTCGHHHGHENCTAITESPGGGVQRCGCQDHHETRAA
jgi:hypothetical protein